MSVGRAKCVSSLPGIPRRADRLDELLAVARELVDRVGAVVNQPDVPLRDRRD